MQDRKYQAQLDHFMRFYRKYDYEIPAKYTEEELSAVQDKDVAAYLNLMAFGVENPGHLDRPTLVRSNTLAYLKKAISYYIPRKMMQWDDLKGGGNPTKSRIVNEVIKAVKKFEVRGEGKPSQAVRELQYEEMQQLLTLTKQGTVRAVRNLKICSLLTLQWQLIARIDDVSHLRFSDIKPNLMHKFAVKCQMRWSKNISEERESPEQLLVPAMDPLFCPILHLALYVEAYDIEKPNELNGSQFLYGEEEDTHTLARKHISQVTRLAQFRLLKNGKVGTHSVRKGAATYVSRCGLGKETVTNRGRWRIQRTVVDRYISPELPGPDASAACTLTGPLGACRYLRGTNSELLTQEFLGERIVPRCLKLFGPQAVEALALPLIWAAYSLPESCEMPSKLRNRIANSLQEAGRKDSSCPVVKVHVVPIIHGDQVSFSDRGTVAAPSISNSAEPGVLAQNTQLLNEFEDVKSTLTSELKLLRSEVKTLKTTIGRLASQPAIVARAPVPTDRPMLQQASLSKVKDLYTLWKEYQFGLHGLKPAKDFTPQERGRQKSKFSRRKNFWDLVNTLLKKGYSSNAAIDLIKATYGVNLPVTSVLAKVAESKRKGFPKELA